MRWVHTLQARHVLYELFSFLKVAADPLTSPCLKIRNNHRHNCRWMQVFHSSIFIRNRWQSAWKMQLEQYTFVQERKRDAKIFPKWFTLSFIEKLKSVSEYIHFIIFWYELCFYLTYFWTIISKTLVISILFDNKQTIIILLRPHESAIKYETIKNISKITMIEIIDHVILHSRPKSSVYYKNNLTQNTQ